MDSMLLILLIISFASLAHGIAGLAFPLIATPLLALFMDARIAIAITLVPTIFINSFSIMTAKHSLAVIIQEYKWLIIMTSAGSALGTWLLFGINILTTKMLLMLAIMAYLFFRKIASLFVQLIQRYPYRTQIIFGLSAGLLGGLTNAMSPLLIVYFLSHEKNPDKIVQASNLCYLMGKMIQLVFFISLAHYSATIININTLSVLAVAIPMLLIGIKIRSYINTQWYQHLLRCILLIIAIILFIQVMISLIY